jgi:transcriptional regulator with XRE-family HTH domain
VTVIDVDRSVGAEESLPDFGGALREARRAAGLTQEQVIERLGRRFARSTLANIETGRERPSERIYAVILDVFPEWEERLAGPFASVRRARVPDQVAPPARESVHRRSRFALGGPYQLEQLQIVYVFQHSRAPEEILESRRIRALASGGDGFGLRFRAQSDGLEIADEVLWGGRLDSSARYDEDGHTTYLQRVDFGRTLRRGQVHDFAVRRWVARDPNPDTEALFCLSLPADEVSLHVKFHGPQRPRRIRRVGPLADHCLVRDRGALESASAVDPRTDVSEYFTKPEIGALYGVIWDW